MVFVTRAFASPFCVARYYFLALDDLACENVVVRSDVKGVQRSLPEVCHEVVGVFFSPRMHQVAK